MKTKILLLCTITLWGLFLHSCDDNDDNIPDVGVCLKQNNNTWRSALGFYAKYQLEELGLTYSMAIATTGTVQDNQITEMINKGCRVIIVSPQEGVSAGAIQNAVAQGIPIIMSEEAIIEDYTTLVQIDNKKVGENAGAFFNEQEISKIAIFSVNDDAASSPRVEGLKSVLNPDIEIEEMELDAYSENEGMTKTQEILTDFKDIDAIYAQDDDIALGVLKAIDNASSLQIKVVVGNGGSQAILDEIKNNTIVEVATTLYSPATFMNNCVIFAQQILRNEETPKIFNAEPTLINKENVEEFISPDSPY